MKLKPLVHQILEDYALPWGGTHGVGHWARVLENGLRVAEATAAKVEVVQLFAVFHDSRRINESIDGGHGLRGAELAAELRGEPARLPQVRQRLVPRLSLHGMSRECVEIVAVAERGHGREMKFASALMEQGVIGDRLRERVPERRAAVSLRR